MSASAVVGKETILTVGARLGSQYDGTVEERVLRFSVGGLHSGEVHGHRYLYLVALLPTA